MAAKSVKKQPSFEEGLAQLEQMADSIESAGLPIEELLKLYEEGMALSAELSKKLDGMKAAMQEVKLGANGKPEVAPSALQSQMDITDMLTEGENQ